MSKPTVQVAFLLILAGLAVCGSRVVASVCPLPLLVPCNGPVAVLINRCDPGSKGAGAGATGLVLRYANPVGAAATYSMRMSGKTAVWSSTRPDAKRQESSITTEMNLRQEVIASTESTITLRTTIDSGKIGTNRGVFGHPAQPVVTTMKHNGEIIENSGFQGLDLKSMQLVFPEHALNIGDRWTASIPASPSVPTELVVTYTVVGIVRFQGEDCVRIRSAVRSSKKSSIHGLDLNVQADGEIYFAYRAGRMLKNDVTSKMSMRDHRSATRSPTITEMEMRMEMSAEIEGPGGHRLPVSGPMR